MAYLAAWQGLGASGGRIVDVTGGVKLVDRRMEETRPSGPMPGASEQRSTARWRTGLGFAIQVAGGLGALLCLVLVILVPLSASRVAASLPESLTLLAEGARRLRDPLELAAGSLGEASAVLNATGAMLLTVGESLESVEPLLTSVGDVVGQDAAEAIDAARSALESAEGGAAAIDSTLRTLSYLGPLTGVTYDPEESLQESLAEVNASLEPLPDDLRGIQDDLDEAVEDLEPVLTSIDGVAAYLESLTVSVEELGEYVLSQSTALGRLAVRADRAADSAPAWVWRVALLLEFLLLLACLEQAVVIVVGKQLRTGGEGWGR